MGFRDFRYTLYDMKEKNTDHTALPEEIRTHLRGLLKETDLPDSDESFERLASAWMQKEKLFTGQTRALDMELSESAAPDDPRGMLLLTNSGSLISLWPEKEGTRFMEYASIALRPDVPDIVKGEGIKIRGPVKRGESIDLENGPLQRTSPLYRISVCGAGLDTGEQEKQIREATIFLTNGFTRINKKTRELRDGEVEHFTKQSIVAYIAQRSDATQKEVRQIIDDYLYLVETGILLGESVPLGNLGRISAKIRPPQKARIGRNPATGEEMTIPAKPAHAVPKMSFSAYIKERTADYIEPE